ncbi:CD1375 family protein [Lactobacillus jensenii]|uniref:CD1375 family protein n=1 Tax=Lactobacillus jensenii TaxID=109790 RepID=UPI00065E880E|nr:CD1375 family protein [Lactobacillus jensenii]
MKPSIMTMNYVTLIQDKKMVLAEVPEALRSEVERWLNYFSTGQLPTITTNGNVGGVNNEN